jgi:hypothetical protein
MAQHPRRQPSLYLSPWEPEISPISRMSQGQEKLCSQWKKFVINWYIWKGELALKLLQIVLQEYKMFVLIKQGYLVQISLKSDSVQGLQNLKAWRSLKNGGSLRSYLNELGQDQLNLYPRLPKPYIKEVVNTVCAFKCSCFKNSQQ